MFRRWPLFAFSVAASLYGCSKAPEPGTAQSPSAVAPADGHESSTAAAPPLSTEDQALADKQKVCPVGGEALGSMGHPVKVMVGDRAVFLCCAGCKGAIEADPEKYLAKLDASSVTTEAETSAAATETPATETPSKPE